jgi:hypothetical protein
LLKKAFDGELPTLTLLVFILLSLLAVHLFNLILSSLVTALLTVLVMP